MTTNNQGLDEAGALDAPGVGFTGPAAAVAPSPRLAAALSVAWPTGSAAMDEMSPLNPFREPEATEASNHQADPGSTEPAAMRQPLDHAASAAAPVAAAEAVRVESDSAGMPDAASDVEVEAAARTPPRQRLSALYQQSLAGWTKQEMEAGFGEPLREAAQLQALQSNGEAAAILEGFRSKLRGESASTMQELVAGLPQTEQVEVLKELLAGNLSPDDHLARVYLYGRRLMAMANELGHSTNDGAKALLETAARSLTEELIRANGAIVDRVAASEDGMARSAQQVQDGAQRIEQTLETLDEKTGDLTELLGDLSPSIQKAMLAGVGPQSAVVDALAKGLQPHIKSFIEETRKAAHLVEKDAREKSFRLLEQQVRPLITELNAAATNATAATKGLLEASKAADEAAANHRAAFEQGAAYFKNTADDAGRLMVKATTDAGEGVIKATGEATKKVVKRLIIGATVAALAAGVVAVMVAKLFA